MSRIKRGWELTKKSWAVLRENRALIRFPLYGGVATILMAIIVVGPGLYLIEDDKVAAGAPLIVIGFYLLAAVGTFFSVGLAHCADRIFQGQPTGVGEGIAFARSHLRQILGWAALSATVGLVFNLLENQAGIVGQIVGRLLDIGWSLITFLAVPVIAIEGTGPIETFKRSASLFKERWGQQLTGNLAIGGAVVLLGMIPAVLLIVAGIAVWASAGFIGALLVLCGIAVLLIAMLISSALGGIFGVALYRYALEGQSVGGFTPGELESAVKIKGGGGPQPAGI
jgi:hypothetical protein